MSSQDSFPLTLYLCTMAPVVYDAHHPASSPESGWGMFFKKFDISPIHSHTITKKHAGGEAMNNDFAFV